MKFAKLKQKKVFLPLAAIALLVVGGALYTRRPKEPTYTTAIVKKMDLIAKTLVTGRVTPAQALDLAFEKVGRVDQVIVEVGSHVKSGDVLVRLDTRELEAQLAQAQAAGESARAQLLQYEHAQEREQTILSELERGTRPEELAIAKTNVSAAQKALDDAAADLEQAKEKGRVALQNLTDGIADILRDSLVKADDALTKQIDELFDNDESSRPTVTFATSGQLATNAQSQRVISAAALAALKQERELQPALNQLSPIATLLDTVNEAVVVATNLTLSTRASYKANINTARTNLNAATAAINKQTQLIASQTEENQRLLLSAQARRNDAQAALERAGAELALKVAGPTKETLGAQQAKLEQAQASVEAQAALVKQAEARRDEVAAQISLRALISSISGVVTKVNGKAGEIVSAGVPVVSLASTGVFQIESRVPEADIAGVTVGALANVTLDAYPSEVIFAARVISIDPAETIVDGVATYTTTLELSKEDARIKSGMTANLEILGSSRTNVLTLPSRAIGHDGGAAKVRRIRGKEEQIVEVKTGLTDSDGNVEILEGLSEGDTVIVS